MAFNRHATQRYLEQDNNAYIDNLLESTKALKKVAGAISVEIRDSCDDIDKIVRVWLYVVYATKILSSSCQRFRRKACELSADLLCALSMYIIQFTFALL